MWIYQKQYLRPIWNCIKGIDTSHKRVQRYYILYGLLVSFFKCNEGSKLISVLLTSSGLFTFLFYGFVAVYVVDVLYVMNKANVALLILYNRGSSRKYRDSRNICFTIVSSSCQTNYTLYSYPWKRKRNIWDEKMTVLKKHACY